MASHHGVAYFNGGPPGQQFVLKLACKRNCWLLRAKKSIEEGSCFASQDAVTHVFFHTHLSLQISVASARLSCPVLQLLPVVAL